MVTLTHLFLINYPAFFYYFHQKSIKTMRILLNTLFFLLILSNSSFAQKKELKTKFGKVSDEEMSMKSYSKDPNASAVVLFDKVQVTHPFNKEQGFIQKYERHCRIKIFKKEAYHHADQLFFYYKNQKISDLKAICYNKENGKVVEIEMEKANVFDEKITKYWLLKKFSIPGVKEGSVIEFKYKIMDEYSLDLKDWYFQQEDIPTIWSEYEAEVPKFLEFNKNYRGWQAFTYNKEEDIKDILNISDTERASNGVVEKSQTSYYKVESPTKKMHFIQEHIPALEPEKYVSAPRRYLSQLNFDIRAVYEIRLMPSGDDYQIVNARPKEYNQTWEKLGEDLWDDGYKDRIKSSKYTEEIAKKTVDGLTTNAEKVAAIYEYIGKNYQVNSLSFAYMTQSIEQLTKDKKGSESDLNLLFINMLSKVGVTAMPMAISTRKNGPIHPTRVSIEAFDRVIASVDLGEEKPVLIDASAYPNPIGLLDENDVNNQGLLVKSSTEIDWIPLVNKISNRTAILSNYTILPEGKLSGDVSYSENGYGAVRNRATLANNDAKFLINKTFKDISTDGTFKEIKTENADKWQEANQKTTFQVETAFGVTVSGVKMYLQPSLGLGIHENPFKNPERKFDIDLGVPFDNVYNFTYQIPAGYKVEAMPKSAKINFSENALTFDYIVETTAEQVKVNIRSKGKKTYIVVAEYEDLKQYYAAILAKMEEQVVFTK
jgi:hypothetical protein